MSSPLQPSSPVASRDPSPVASSVATRAPVATPGAKRCEVGADFATLSEKTLRRRLETKLSGRVARDRPGSLHVHDRRLPPVAWGGGTSVEDLSATVGDVSATVVPSMGGDMGTTVRAGSRERGDMGTSVGAGPWGEVNGGWTLNEGADIGVTLRVRTGVRRAGMGVEVCRVSTLWVREGLQAMMKRPSGDRYFYKE